MEDKEALLQGRFEGEVLAKLDGLAISLKDMKTDYITLEGRVRTLEQWKFLIIGAAVVFNQLLDQLLNYFQR
jgi:hypothetical protein